MNIDWKRDKEEIGKGWHLEELFANVEEYFEGNPLSEEIEEDEDESESSSEDDN